MTVIAARRSVAGLLRSELSNEFVIVPSPDHPLLLDAPDIIAGGNGGLTNIFFPSSNEIRRPKLLENRLMLSRLALPTHARNVLILRSSDQIEFGHNFSADFSDVVLWKDKIDAVKIVADRDFFGNQREIPTEIIREAKLQYADAYKTTQVMRKIRARSESRAKTESLPSPSDISRKGRAYAAMSASSPFKGSIVNFSSGVVSPQELRKLINRRISESFSLDTSVPYPKPESAYGLSVVEQLPEYPGDPDKLIRAAAFGGWAMITFEQDHEKEEILESLNARRKRRKSWQ